MLAAISAGFAGSRMLDLMGPKMAGRDFAAGIEARLHHKDYGLIVDMAREAHLAMPAVAIVAQQLNALMSNGWGTLDTSALLKVLGSDQRPRRLTRPRVRWRGRVRAPQRKAAKLDRPERRTP